MRILPKETPTPRLLTSLVPESRQEIARSAPSNREFSPHHASFFSGNGRAILFGLLIGAVAFSTVGILYSRHRVAAQDGEAQRKLVPAATHSVSSSQHPEASPAPILVQVHADLIHVTAISLGHPRLAIINNQQVSEGALLTLHTPTASVALTLRVLKIGDGRIELSDGTQTIVARLELPNPHTRR
ncbi:MAG TPA: hypothetical protein VJU77_11040 [Chthoniobacterales bacterium]|nr:hypothetical protein [Chthoniobacterales bacterium]